MATPEATVKGPVYKKLGQGSYGYVLEPAVPNRIGAAVETYPGNVTKVFRNKQSFQNAMATVQKITEIMGPDEGHRAAAYQYPYTIQNLYANLPTNIQEQYSKNIRTSKKKPTNRLHMMRLPNLGFDITQVTRNKEIIKQIRNVPILTILQQVKKVVEQTLHMTQKQYIHADIRNTNVMIHPTTGTITIIDFDWLKPIDTIYHEYPFGFYNNPPELLFYSGTFPNNTSSCAKLIPIPVPPAEMRQLNLVKQKYPDADYEEVRYMIQYKIRKGTVPTDEKRVLGPINQYIRHQKYTNFYDGLLIGFGGVMQLRECDDRASFDKIMQEVGCDNWTFIHGLTNPTGSDREFIFYRDYIAPTFDNYGLGLTLLELFYFLYPGCITKGMLTGTPHENIAGLHVNLKSRITNNGTPYTDAEIEAIANALTETAMLFHLMGSFRLQDRPKPEIVVEMMSNILDIYVESTKTNKAGGYFKGRSSKSGNRKTRRNHKKARKQTRKRL